MAWLERQADRRRASRTYQDASNPTTRQFIGATSPLNYESALDSGAFDTPVNLTPQRVQNAQLDGWTITENGWHYALGKPAGQADGWVGFGGRQGAHWLKFRLARIGYLDWATRAWQDIGGAPTYNRANLTSQTRATRLPDGSQQQTGSLATWDGLWSTPAGGSVSVSWAADGDGLEELVTVSQAARTWVAANRPPATPATETYFGFVYQLDVSDVPRALVNGALVDLTTDVETTSGLTLEDAAGKLLALLPVDYAWSSGDPRQRLQLRKRIYKDADGLVYLAVGCLVTDVAALPAGDLLFDPSFSGGASNVWYWTQNAGSGSFSTSPWFGTWSTYQEHAGFFFSNVTIANGVTVSAASMSSTIAGYDNSGAENAIIGAYRHASNPSVPTTYSQASTLASGPASTNVTTNQVTWSGSAGTSGNVTTPDFSAVAQEVFGESYWASGQDLLVFIFGNASSGGSNNDTEFSATASATTISITYGTGGTNYTHSSGVTASATVAAGKTPEAAKSVAATATIAKAALASKSASVSATGTLAHVAKTLFTKAAAVVATGTVAATRLAEKTIGVTASAAVSVAKSARRILSVTASAILSLVTSKSVKGTPEGVTDAIAFTRSVTDKTPFTHAVSGAVNFPQAQTDKAPFARTESDNQNFTYAVSDKLNG